MGARDWAVSPAHLTISTSSRSAAPRPHLSHDQLLSHTISHHTFWSTNCMATRWYANPQVTQIKRTLFKKKKKSSFSSSEWKRSPIRPIVQWKPFRKSPGSRLPLPWHAEPSLASKNYRREMPGMFKVNKMEGLLLTESKQGFGDFCLLSIPLLFVICCCLGNQRLWHFKLEILYLFPRALLPLSWQRGLVIKSIRFWG